MHYHASEVAFWMSIFRLLVGRLSGFALVVDESGPRVVRCEEIAEEALCSTTS